MNWMDLEEFIMLKRQERPFQHISNVDGEMKKYTSK